MATKKGINRCIEMIESMDIQINYRDKIFLEEVGLPNPRQKKKKPTFNQIISALHKNNKNLEELEEKYRQKKTTYALKANDDLMHTVHNAKEQIAEAFIPFIDEVQNEVEIIMGSNRRDLSDMYLEYDSVYAKQDGVEINKFNRGLHLVYADMKSREAVYTSNIYDDWGIEVEINGEAIDYETVPANNEYSFSELPKLLDVIAKVTTEYCKKMDKEDRTEVFVGEGKKGQTTPLFIRQSCAWVCYILLYFGDILSKYFLQEPLTTQSGVCSQIMHDLHLRTKQDYGYEYFAKEKKLLEYNKWSILPEVILREGNFIAPVSPVKYAGHKSGYLGFMLQSLIDQRVFDTYIEPFGGSGTGITQFHKKDGVKYYISDANYANMCFYKVLLDNTLYKKFLKKLKKEQKELQEIYAEFDSYDFSDDNIKREIKGIYREGYVPTDEDKIFFDNWKYKAKGKVHKIFDINWYINNPKNDFKDTEFTRELFKEVHSMLGYQIKVKKFYIKHYDLYTDVSNMNIGSVELKKYDIVELAVAFVILHTSLVQGVQISVDQSLTRESRPYFLSLNIDEEFNALYKEYKGINIPLPEAEYGASAMDLLKNPKYNKAGTFAYLDSPYICTMGYAKGFDKKMMEDLIDSCKAFKGDFVFSCRINLPSGTLKTLRGKKGESKNVSIDNKKKFIWFMEQWLDTDYKVLFMIPEKTEADKNITMLAYIKKCLKECIIKPINLELMICNFDFDEPDYDLFMERYINAYKPRKTIKNNSYFIQLPVKEIAEMVINEYSKY